MKRELKFRVWNGMEMVYDVTVGRFGVFYVNPEKGDGLNPSDTASLTPNTTKYFDGTPVMQYTGINDKNGVDVYEGDIVSVSLNGEHIGDDMVIEWEEERCRFDLDWYGGLSIEYEIEVIGHIYSNLNHTELREEPDVFTDKEVAVLKKRFDDFILTEDKKCLLKSTNQGFGSIMISKKDHKIIYYNHAPTGCDPDDGKVYGYYTNEVQYNTAEDCALFRNGIELKNN